MATERTKQNHGAYIVLAIFITIGVFMIIPSHYFVGFPQNPYSAGAMNSLAAAELPSRATKTQVAIWLKSKFNKDLHSRQFHPEYRRDVEVAGKAHVPLSSIHSVEEAFIPDTHRELLSQDGLQLFFFFDDSDLLIGYYVNTVIVSW